MVTYQHLADQKELLSHKLTDTDTLVNSYFLVPSPIPVVILSIFYLGFVLWLGPKLMEKRKPFQINGTVMAFDLFQMASCVYVLVLPFFRPRVTESMKDWCRTPETQRDVNPDVVYISWLYFMAKIIDLIDTVFFVLRKKQNQVTFLHVYHHVVMMNSCWFYMKYSFDPTAIVLQQLNTFVHLIMYLYYFLSALGPDYAKYLWWKKYITVLQLSQFVIAFSYLCVQWFHSCQISKVFVIHMLVNLALLIGLFGDFYKKSYSKKAKNKLND